MDDKPALIQTFTFERDGDDWHVWQHYAETQPNGATATPIGTVKQGFVSDPADVPAIMAMQHKFALEMQKIVGGTLTECAEDSKRYGYPI